jgi:NAD(P)H dehydrogenase (quinone)
VYAPEWKQDFLSFESVKDIPYDEKREKIQEKIRWADEIVCVCPLWWMDTPAILKNFFDTNFTAGFAYKYENGYPKGLLSPKTAQMVFTCDANKWLFLLLGFPFYMLWRFARFGFCGISLKNLLVFDKKRKRSEQEHEDFLKALKNRLF